ncbi:hypothetical protein DXG01_011642, partial [Tephrocybe rancida]
EILADDEVRVELSTLKREVFHLSQLSNVNDMKLQPLMYKFNPGTFNLADMPPPAIPKSILPLTPSTPIPTGSSVEMAAAWNPSSRTPNPTGSFPVTPTWNIGTWTGNSGSKYVSTIRSQCSAIPAGGVETSRMGRESGKRPIRIVFESPVLVRFFIKIQKTGTVTS